MGTSLTGTKPKDTYDSLIKVGDNGPISGTAKVLSDGLGNDLPIAVSTSRVGVGTSSPIEKATINGLVAVNGASVTSYYVGNNNSAFVDFATNQTRIGAQVSSGASSIAFLTASSGYTTIAERVRVTDAGLTFNGDTAAANALDDYEEGTWSPAVAFGGASTGITYADGGGKYTKIGRQVTATCYVALSNKGSATGAASLTGLPFTVPSGSSSFTPATVWFYEIDFGGQFQAYGSPNSTNVILNNVSEAGTLSALTDASFQNNSEIMLAITYFV